MDNTKNAAVKTARVAFLSTLKRLSFQLPVLCCEPEQLPDEFQKVEVTARLNEIKKAIKANPSIDWAFWSDTTEYSLTIR